MYADYRLFYAIITATFAISDYPPAINCQQSDGNCQQTDNLCHILKNDYATRKTFTQLILHVIQLKNTRERIKGQCQPPIFMIVSQNLRAVMIMTKEGRADSSSVG